MTQLLLARGAISFLVTTAAGTSRAASQRTESLPLPFTGHDLTLRAVSHIIWEAAGMGKQQHARNTMAAPPGLAWQD